MQKTIVGVVLKEIELGENDKLIKFLTPEKGIINIILPNAKKLRSKNSGALQVFYYCEVTLFKGRKEYYIVDEVNIKERFEGIRYDIEKFSIAEYFCEMFLVLSPREGESRDFLRLILNSLYFLEKGEIDIKIMKAIVELRICSMSGYMPDMIGCIVCREYKKDETYFDIKNSCLICDSCLGKSDKNYNLILINSSVLDAMRHIIYSKIEKLYFFKLSTNSIELLSNISERYVMEHIDYKFKSLEFFKSIDNYAVKVRREHGKKFIND